MKQSLLFIFILMTIITDAQKLKITTIDGSNIEVTLIGSTSKAGLIKQPGVKQNNNLRKNWTSRTFQLTDGQILIEFYDGQAALVNSLDDFKRLTNVRFVKNTLDFLKKNISYKIELDYDKGLHVIQSEKPRRLDSLKSDMSEVFDFEVYRMNAGQILFLDKSKNFKSTTIYADLKTLASDNTTIAGQVYGSDDDEYLMKKLAAGDVLPDYEPDNHLIYPKYLKNVISSHKLTLVEQKVHVSDFYSNLYQSANGYYMLIDEIDQQNGAGNTMPILSLWIYPSIQQVREAQRRYQEFKKRGISSEHFYKNLSDKYGKRFPEFVDKLIDNLPTLLNIDQDQLSLDSLGMNLVDEALKWNGVKDGFFDSVFPSLVAYYGKCYISRKRTGKWDMIFDKEVNVWIPMVKLDNGNNVWDWIHFYKDLYEGPIPLMWAGNWDGTFTYK
ncbi:MAG: hypothetical protein V4577_10515 [Bacteroidota bacterium]